MRAKELQTAKIHQIADALVEGGYIGLDEQAGVLGLSRSTTWNVILATHKNSGLSGAVIKRMLAQPRLPQATRAKILEYVEDKSAGIYGHTPRQERRFLEALSPLCPATRLSWLAQHPRRPAVSHASQHETALDAISQAENKNLGRRR